MKVNEIKLGFFVLIALILLIVLVFSVKDFSMFNPSYPIKITFNFADGVKPASPVRLAGVGAGEVKEIAVVEKDGKTQVFVYALIQNDIKIPRNSEVFVNSLGLLGEKYLEIIPRDNTKGYLQPGDTIKGEDSVPIYRLNLTIKDSLNQLNQVLSSIENIVGDEETVNNLKASIENLKSASFNAQAIMVSLRSDKGTIGKLLYHDSLHQELEEFVADLKAHPWKLLYVPKGQR